MGSKFSHVAISYRGRWLHTHPYRGVELATQKTLQEMGRIASTILIPDHAEPDDAFVNSILGTPYETQYSWESNRYYCSKLIAKILDLRPAPMNFNAAAWPAYFKRYNGLLGISPQGVFNQLVQKGYSARSIP